MKRSRLMLVLSLLLCLGALRPCSRRHKALRLLVWRVPRRRRVGRGPRRGRGRRRIYLCGGLDRLGGFPRHAGAYRSPAAMTTSLCSRDPATRAGLPRRSSAATGAERAWAMAVDGAGSAYVVGAPSRATGPPRWAWDRSYGSAGDAFAAKLSPSGAALGVQHLPPARRADEEARAVAVDAPGAAYAPAGPTRAPFPHGRASTARTKRLGCLCDQESTATGADWLTAAMWLAAGRQAHGSRGCGPERYVAGWTNARILPDDAGRFQRGERRQRRRLVVKIG